MKQHAQGFLDMVKEAMTRIKEVTAEDVNAMLARREHMAASRQPSPERRSMREPAGSQREHHDFVLIDVREDGEWAAGHIAGAMHLGRGILERDIEKTVPDKDTAIVLYCGGGYRSALSADSLQKMGYSHVLSMAGGWSGWCQKDLPKALPVAGLPNT